MKFFKHIAFTCLAVIFLSACGAQIAVQQGSETGTSDPTVPSSTQNVVLPEEKTDTPSASAIASTSATPLQPEQAPSFCLVLPENTPIGLEAQIQALNKKVCRSDSERLQVKLGQGEGPQVGSWVYALVAPFPTVTDGISTESLLNFWKMGSPAEFSILGMTPETAEIFETLWGKPIGRVEVMASEALSSWAWETKLAWAIIPFETLSPRLKVISLENSSPIQKAFQVETYALSVPIRLELPEALDENLILSVLNNQLLLTNRDPQKMATVILTGVTSMVRATAWGMENAGLDKPAEEIGQALLEADITHISNEVSFAADCPDPKNEHLSLRFCSKEAYLETLQLVGTDVVELTGDHLNDWGDEALLNTLAIYNQAKIQTFGGGASSTAASEPALFEVNSNKIAFIGCNSKGVGYTMATASTPGALACDMDKMVNQIKDLVQHGYMPIVGIQHSELSGWYPSQRMKREFAQLAQAGAVIVSGSQAHRPQTFSFGGTDGKAFLHYGLGNLFFDQDTMGGEYAKAFIDRHVFYNGHHISTEILTIQFPDSLTPVWADAATRQEMLNLFFWTSGLVPWP